VAFISYQRILYLVLARAISMRKRYFKN